MSVLLAVELVRPEALWLLAIVGAVAVVARKQFRNPRTGLALLLRLLALMACVFALARPRTFEQVDEVAVAFLLDVSESIPPESRGQVLRRVGDDFERLRPGDLASLIVFAERPSVEIPFVSSAGMGGDAGIEFRLQNLESRVSLAHTDIARALRFTEGLFPPGKARKIVLASDGNSTRGDLDEAARALRAAGVQMDVLPIIYHYETEVLVEGLFGPGRAPFEEPVQLRGVITARAATDAEVVLLENGTPIGDHQRLRLDAGTNVLRWTVIPSQPGYGQYEMRVMAERDNNPANNVGRAGVIVSGGSSVLVASGSEEDERLSAVLSESGMVVEKLRPSALPRHPAGYVSANALVLANVPAFELENAQIDAIRDAVQQLGLGLVIAGGDRAFAPGGYRGTALEELIPVSLDTTNRKRQPKGALVIVLHSIEFDSGNTWAARICKAGLRALEPTDEAGIVYFDYREGEKWLFDLQPVADKAKLESLIEAVQVGDMPSFHNCFILAEKSLSRSDAAIKHVVVISDGDPQAPSPELLIDLSEQHVTISTFCINPHGFGDDVQRMSDIASVGGGRYHLISGESLEQIPRLLIKEAVTVRRRAVREEPFVPAVALPSSPLLRGLDGAWPMLHGYVITSPRPDAETVLLADVAENDPLLAAWYTGIGRVVAFTSDASSRWAREWLGWERFGPFWTQAVRSTFYQGEAGSLPLTVSVEGLAFEVMVQASSEDEEPLTELAISGTLLGEEHQPVTVSFSETEAGRYVGRGTLPAPGHFLLSIQTKIDDRVVQSTTTVSCDFAPEYRALQSREGALGAAAALTGGRILGKDDDALTHEIEGVRGRVELWAWLCGMAAFLVLADLVVRRFELAPLARHVFDRARARLPRVPVRASPSRGGKPRLEFEETTTKEPPPRAAADPREGARPPETLDALKKARRRAEERRRWK